MSNEHDTMLQQVTEETLESLAFAMVMPEEDHADPFCIAAKIEFSGPSRGALFFSASERFMPEVATNMLGSMDDEPPSEELQRDAFKELLNVICGNLLPVFAGDEAVFDVHPAEILAGACLPGTFEQHEPTAQIEMTLDIGRIKLAFFAIASQCAKTE